MHMGGTMLAEQKLQGKVLLKTKYEIIWHAR